MPHGQINPDLITTLHSLEGGHLLIAKAELEALGSTVVARANLLQEESVDTHRLLLAARSGLVRHRFLLDTTVFNMD